MSRRRDSQREGEDICRASRLTRLSEIFGSERILPATVSFVDIAGIVKGASEGEGMGNAFLANIREADAICQVTRAFSDPDVIRQAGSEEPAGDMEVVSTELILADLQTLENARQRVEKDVKRKLIEMCIPITVRTFVSATRSHSSRIV